MSLYSLGSLLRRGQEALEWMVHSLLDTSTTLLPPGGTTGWAGKRRQLPPSPFVRKMRAHQMAYPWLWTCPRPLS